jgi:hypothetical protein
MHQAQGNKKRALIFGCEIKWQDAVCEINQRLENMELGTGREACMNRKESNCGTLL